MDYSYPLLCSCERNGDRVALLAVSGAVTYSELEARVAGLSAGLGALGVAGTRVASILHTEPETFELYLALARAGAVSVPVNTRLSQAEKRYILDDAGVRLLVADDEFADEARHLAAESATVADVLLVSSLVELRDAPTGDPPTSSVGDEAGPATILYTSGTTGFPKGVVRSHRANTWNVVNSALGSPRSPGDVELFTLPAFGIGFLHFALAALLGGATVVLDRAFEPARAWQLLEEHRATRAFFAPTMLDSMLAVPGQEDRDISSLEIVYTAYAFPAPLRERALQRFGDRFAYMYGLTEAQLTCAQPARFAAQPTNVGTAMGVARVGVFDRDGRPLPPGEHGEIGFEGPSVMSGYHGLPDATADALRGGWVMTGDLGVVDAAGDLHYVGRSKEMIKTGGFSVDPTEVENAILTLDGVDAAAVLGVEDEHWGEKVIAFVAPAGRPDVDAAAVIAACRSQIAGYKVPKQVFFVDALPVNATGKVERAVLRRTYRAALLEESE
jgi:acyl-CoA synthetase (AMP-forming)/AMP-acid ligase II